MQLNYAILARETTLVLLFMVGRSHFPRKFDWSSVIETSDSKLVTPYQ